MTPDTDVPSARLWTAVALGVSLPFVIVLCTTLWLAPYPITDSIGHFEDVQRRPAASFLVPSSSYYRPLFYLTLSGIWNNAPTIDSALTAIRFFHIVPIALLVVLLIGLARPRTPIDAAAAMLAVAVLVGSPGFRDNLELPLSYTIVGMPVALAVWMLAERERRMWHGAAIIALALVAIGFKEQGLAIVPLVIAAWWLGAPGVTRGTAATLAIIAMAYVVFRLNYHDARLPMFEQDVGFLYSRMSPEDAEARFGTFPLWIYAYSGASTIGTVLFAEPTEGIFRVTRALTAGPLEPWHVVHLASSVALTAVIVWWGVAALRRGQDRVWSPDARLFLVMLVVVAATGALSFNYSRDRLGGMAVPLYALAAFHAVRAAAVRAAAAPRLAAAAIALVLVLLGAGWQLRALYTTETAQYRAVNTEREWTTRFERRREEFRERTVYAHILDQMLEQGTNPGAIRRLRYPRWLERMLGEH
jgi:hypothetical protein